MPRAAAKLLPSKWAFTRSEWVAERYKPTSRRQALVRSFQSRPLWRVLPSSRRSPEALRSASLLAALLFALFVSLCALPPFVQLQDVLVVFTDVIPAFASGAFFNVVAVGLECGRLRARVPGRYARGPAPAWYRCLAPSGSWITSPGLPDVVLQSGKGWPLGGRSRALPGCCGCRCFPDGSGSPGRSPGCCQPSGRRYGP